MAFAIVVSGLIKTNWNFNFATLLRNFFHKFRFERNFEILKVGLFA